MVIMIGHSDHDAFAKKSFAWYPIKAKDLLFHSEVCRQQLVHQKVFLPFIGFGACIIQFFKGCVLLSGVASYLVLRT